MTVRISKHPLEDLAAGLPPGRNTLLDQIAVLSFMTVKLTGGKAFEIRPLEPENQFVSTDRATEWNFDVKAVRAGEQNLDLVVGVRVKLSKGGEETRFYPLYTRNVKVTVNVWYSTKQFLTDHWEVIMTAIVLPLIAYWWKQRKKKPSSDLAEP
jgi:hypothetical protein